MKSLALFLWGNRPDAVRRLKPVQVEPVLPRDGCGKTHQRLACVRTGWRTEYAQVIPREGMHNPLQYLIEGMDAISFSACQGQYALNAPD